tara:strand:+ start:434 stop:2245 length:1812 start_codon:yes stop_codon:yes gene_type:complete
MTTKRLFSFGCPTLEEFETHARRAKELGATHIMITADLPPAMWQYEESGDPYTAWFVINPGLLKIFPPEAVAPFVDTSFAGEVVDLLKERCEILRKLGLKGYWFTNEPQVLPEAFFLEYPHLRGPRVDQSNRARLAHFAPCADQQETLDLYADSMKRLLTECPEIELFYFLTTDSGSGFCWSPALYPGKNGNTLCKHRPMEDRVSGWLLNLRRAAESVGKNILVDINEIEPREWMLPTFADPMKIIEKLEPGLAINHMEGPTGNRFISRGMGPVWWNPFYPVVGIARPFDFIRQCVEEAQQEASIRVSTVNDIENADLLFHLLKKYQEQQPETEYESMTLLREAAEEIGGEAQADRILSLWMRIDQIEKYLGTLDFGPLFIMTCVLTRWTTRPLLPFPEELPKEDKEYYLNYILQSKGDEQADNPLDVQAMDMFKGWGAKLLVQSSLSKVEAEIKAARDILSELVESAEGELKQQWRLWDQKMDAMRCLVRNVDQVVSHQAHIDRIKARVAEVPVDQNPVLGLQGGWDYEDCLNTARAEIDNSLYLKRLIETADGPLIDIAPDARNENVLRFGPDFTQQLKLKTDIMNAHWQDYTRLFETPNP